MVIRGQQLVGVLKGSVRPTTLCCTQVIHYFVVGNGIHPSAEWLGRIVSVLLCMYCEQGDLQQVFSVGWISLAAAEQLATDVAAQLRAEFGQQSSHCVAVAVAGAQQERA